LRRPGLWAFAAWTIVAATPGAVAQEPVAAPAALYELSDGDRVRVLVPPDEAVEGDVARVDSGRLVLRLDQIAEGAGASTEQAASFESIEALWTRSRRTWLGAGIGGGVGAVLGGLTGAVAAGLCEGECDDETVTIVAVGLLGAAAGALVGGLVGSAVSRWNLQFEQEADGRGWAYAPGPEQVESGARLPSEVDPLRGRTGWLVAQAGGSLSSWSEFQQAGVLVGGAVVADFGVLRVGPEVLLGGIGGSQGVVTYGGVVHVPVAHGSMEPYLIAGAGGQAWNSTGPDYNQLDASLFALNGGFGLRFPVGSRTAAGAELRAHHSVQNYGGPVPWLFTLAATFGFGL